MALVIESLSGEQYLEFLNNTTQSKTEMEYQLLLDALRNKESVLGVNIIQIAKSELVPQLSKP